MIIVIIELVFVYYTHIKKSLFIYALGANLCRLCGSYRLDFSQF